MYETVIPADTRLRTQVIVWGTCTLVLGLACILYLNTYLDALTALHTAAPQLAAEQIQRLFFLLAIGIALLTGLLAGIVSYLAVRVLKAGQYPPPGMRVIRDTKLKTGREAKFTAIIAMTLTALALLCGIGLSGMLLWASHDLGREYRSPRLEAAVPSTDRLVSRFCDCHRALHGRRVSWERKQPEEVGGHSPRLSTEI